MKKLSLILAGLLLPFVAFAQVSNDNEDGAYSTADVHRNQSRPGQVIVKFKEGSNATACANSKGFFATTRVSAVDNVLNKLGTKKMESLMPLTGSTVSAKSKSYLGKDVEDTDLSALYVVEFEDSVSVDEAVDALKELDDVEYAEPNYVVYLLGTGDGDKYKKDPLYNNNGHWGITGINIYNLWNTPKITTKRPVIAILDTGVDIDHPDLADNIWTNTNEKNGVENADDDANGFKDDVHGWDFVNNTPRIRDNNGHGTHCAGIAGAVGGNGIGAAGVNPDAWIMPVTVMQSDGTGDVATIIKGIDYAAANGADVISMSFGGYSHSMAEEQALAHAYATAVLVAAAGNDGHTIETSKHCLGCMAGGMPMFPAAYTFVLGVQSSQSSGALASFSNWDNNGPIYSSYGEEKLYNYELTAPGVKIISTFPNGKYKELSGTSMACPAVAGAISRLMQCKELGSKEELFGDLINSKTSTGNLDIYKAYQMSDANRRPTLNLITYNLDDSAGDGDGRPDAGETIDIYPVLRNAWGTANNIRVSIELAETEDPEIVQIINGTADFGWTLNSYAKNTSANPLRIKINDECADGRHICLVIKVTCDNVTENINQDVTLIAENGVELFGNQSEDIVLTANNHYILSGNWGILENVNVTIEPGTIIEMKGYQISSLGRIISNGTPGNFINFKGPGTFAHINKAEFTYTSFENFPRHIFPVPAPQRIENCVFRQLGEAIIYDPTPDYIISKNKLDSLRIEKCNIFESTGGYITTYTATMARNLYNNLININGSNFPVAYSVDQYTNAFANSYNYSYNSSTPKTLVPIRPLYHGTCREDIARRSIFDMLNPSKPQGFGVYSLENMAPRPYSEAHGIVWKVVVNGKDAQDEFEELAPLGVGKHKFEVYFNRPMNKDVAPIISMGVRYPYSSISIAEEDENSGWNEAGDIYTAYLTITGKTKADGLNRIRVYGAEDDEFFEVPEEKYRFNVNVQAAGSMATGLEAEAGLGKVNLNWETRETDFDDLLGFNVYRYTEDNKTPVMINNGLVEPGKIEDGVMSQSFTDFDVIPGNTYYYIIKEMSTDLSQSEVSNPVACTPLTAEKGDANGSMTVDVADVVTEINYLTGQNPQPFIFEAADVNEDNNINILDVVGTVNIIMAPEVGANSIGNGTAKYTVENGILYVEADEPLGGLQISINAPKGTEFEVLEGLNGMEAATAWKSDNEFMLLSYSMSKNCIPTGKNAILRIGGNDVKNVVLSNTQGQNIVALDGDLTAVGAVSGEAQIALPYPSPFTDELHIPYSISKAGQSEVRLVITDLAGRTVNTYAATKAYGNYEYVWNPSANVTKGVYLVTLYVDGKQMQSSKVIKL